MFFYKLRKILREKFIELIRSVSILAFIAAFVPFFPILFLYHDDFSKSDKKQMCVVSFICIVLNLTIIYFTDNFFQYNIIISIFLGDLISFFLYLIPFSILIMYFEFSEIQLDKSEIRDAKLESLFRKLF